MAAIHHATLKRANMLGIELLLDGASVIALLAGEEIARAYTGKEALAAAEAEIARHSADAKPKRARKPRDEDGEDEESEDEDEESEDEDDEAGDEESEDGEGEDEGEESPAASGSIVKPKYRKIYQPKQDSCGDTLADDMRDYLTVEEEGIKSIDLRKLRRLADANGVWNPRYANLNAGQQRMNVGNRLRALVRNGREITWP